MRGYCIFQIVITLFSFQIFYDIILKGEGSFTYNVTNTLDYYNILRTQVPSLCMSVLFRVVSPDLCHWCIFRCLISY